MSRGSLVLDPFLGVGTTLLTCRELGINSVGFDVSPLFVFISEVKLRDYDVDELRRVRDEIFSIKFEKPEVKVSGFLRNLYPKPVLEDLFFFKGLISKISDEEVRDFFTLALMVAAEKSSYMMRDGAVIKIVKNKPRIPSLRKAYRIMVNRMIDDVEKLPLTDASVKAMVGDARRMESVETESVDAVITSPPYLNKIEYTRCYWPEYEIFFPHISHTGIRSYLSMRPDDVELSMLGGDAPLVAELYFEDMEKVCGEVYRVLKPGGAAVMVVGGGVFPDKVIQVDVAVAEIAERCGLNVERIVAVNKRVAAVDRVRKIGESRESIIYLRK
ncbi:MAG: DNA methyltransferase [Candidatus Caldarchaeum sp.]